jgi:uncharacterized protein (DUF58 family)
VTTRWPTFRIAAYSSLAVLGAVAALVLGRPEPALLASPFALYLAVGLALADERTAALDPATAAVRPRQLRAVEGDVVELEIDAPPGSEVRLTVPTGLSPIGADPASPRVARFAARRWGAHRVGRMSVRTTDPLRLFINETPVDHRDTVRVHPSAATLRRAVAAAELQRRVGNHTSRARGDGVEFADVRPFTRGDRARSVNWRASARRNELWVNDRRPERNADVVLLLDTFGDDHAHRHASLERAVRALAAIAVAYHGQRDRLGLLTFGGQLRWVPLGLGERALFRVVDGLLDTEILLSSSWDEVVRVPIGALPTHALLLAVTALDNDTAVRTLIDLRGRGFDVAVVSLPLPTDALAHTDLGRRLVALQRDARRLQLERLGVAVSTAASLDDLPVAIEEVERCRRRLPRVRA